VSVRDWVGSMARRRGERREIGSVEAV